MRAMDFAEFAFRDRIEMPTDNITNCDFVADVFSLQERTITVDYKFDVSEFILDHPCKFAKSCIQRRFATTSQ
jgi:hypothetical protein